MYKKIRLLNNNKVLNILILIDKNKLNLIRWFFAGFIFMIISMFFLFLFVDLMKFSVPTSTLLVAEISTFLRFFINHYWVFKQRNPTIRGCIHYHFANATAFVMWWITANILSYNGVHYLIAGVSAICLSTLVSLTSNFLWVWRNSFTDK